MLVRLVLAAAVIFAATATPLFARDLAIVSRGDGLLTALQEVYVQPFTMATEIPVIQESWEGGLDTLRTRVKTPDNGWDIVQVDPDELATGCSEGIFEKLDWPAVGGKEHYAPMAVSDCGVGAVLANVVLAWDKEKFPATPNWADFWDVAKYPGKRGLAKGLRTTLEIALMADGVAPGDVYKTLGSAEGVDRAFRKLDQLIPYIAWWQTEADAARILASGDVLMTTAPSGRVVTANRMDKRKLGIQFAASLYEVQSWAVLKGSPNLRQAQQFLYFAGTPAIAVRLLRLSGDAGLAKGINEGLTPELLAISPTAQPNLSVALRIDAGFWRDNAARLKPRFDAWLGP